MWLLLLEFERGDLFCWRRESGLETECSLEFLVCKAYGRI